MTSATTQGDAKMSGGIASSIVVATVAAFILSSLCYMLFGRRLAALSPAYATGARPSGPVVGLELLRSLVVATVLTVLAADTWLQGAGPSLLAWVGFPLVILAGSVLHERYRWQLAAVHLGDWLLKLVLVVAAIVSAWR